MFIELNGRRCLVVGGGGIALHKIRVLKEFGADVLVVSPTVLPEILELKGVSYRRKSFDRSDLAGQELVVAATDDAEQNRRISELCREKHIPVNAVDQIKDCSFIFPAYLKEGEVVAAFSSGGQSGAVSERSDAAGVDAAAFRNGRPPGKDPSESTGGDREAV